MADPFNQVVGQAGVSQFFAASQLGPFLPAVGLADALIGSNTPKAFGIGSPDLSRFNETLGDVLERLEQDERLSAFGTGTQFRSIQGKQGDLAAFDFLEGRGATDQELANLAQALGISRTAASVNDVLAGKTTLDQALTPDPGLQGIAAGLPAPQRVASILVDPTPANGAFSSGVPTAQFEEAGGSAGPLGFGAPFELAAFGAASAAGGEVPPPAPPAPSGSPESVALLAFGGIALLVLIVLLR